jgi:hypothetical protein
MAIISDDGVPRRAKVINLAEAVGRCNVFFVTHAVVLSSQENLDLIIIGDFEGGSGMGNLG